MHVEKSNFEGFSFLEKGSRTFAILVQTYPEVDSSPNVSIYKCNKLEKTFAIKRLQFLSG